MLKDMIVLLAVGLAVACVDRRADTDTSTASAARGDTGTHAVPDDCVRGEPEPVLILSDTSGPATRFRRTAKLEATEDAQVDDTTSLRIMHGGCAHYVEHYAFTVRGAVRDTVDSDYWLRRAAAYLRALDVGERRASQIDQMASAIETAAAKSEPYAYGDPLSVPEFTIVSCTVRRAAPDTVVVDIIYDVAL